jgi:prophage regulatory protein
MESIELGRAQIDSQPSQQLRLVRLDEVLKISGLSRSGMYAAVKKGTFPAPVKLRSRSSAWVMSEIEEWVRHCIEAWDK